MTLLEELSLMSPARLASGRVVELENPPFRLPFDGELSADELKLAEKMKDEP